MINIIYIDNNTTIGTRDDRDKTVTWVDLNRLMDDLGE